MPITSPPAMPATVPWPARTTATNEDVYVAAVDAALNAQPARDAATDEVTAWMKLAADQVETDAGTATTKAEEASGSAITAGNAAAAAGQFASSALNAPGTSATSTTEITIPTSTPASRSLTIQTGKEISVGQFVNIASTASPGNYMAGQITAHDSGTGALTVNVVQIDGSGTFAAWTIALAANGNAAQVDKPNTFSAHQIFGLGAHIKEVALGAGSAIDLQAGNVFTKTISGTTTLSLTNVPASGITSSFGVALSGGGSATVNWWANIVWDALTPPVLSASGYDLVTFLPLAGGTMFFGMHSVKGS